jgi:hypothetical protein
MADNMGGIISAEYCLVSELLSFAAIKNGILLALKSGSAWKEFPAKIGNIEIDVSQVENVVHDSWTISGKIRCPRKAYQNTREMILFRMYNKIIVKYTTANGDVLVIGTKQYPITVTQKILTGVQASEYSGVEYTLSGAQYSPQLPLL